MRTLTRGRDPIRRPLARFAARCAARLIQHLPTAHADLAPFYAAAPSLAPAAPDPTARIALVRERVRIDLYPHTAVVIAAFELHNHDAATDLEVALPCVGGRGATPCQEGALDDFSAVVGGRGLLDAPLTDFEIDGARAPVDVASTVEGEGDWPAWKVWRQRFAGHDATVIKVRYTCALRACPGGSRMPFTYVLRTGGLWHGPIGEVTVEVRAAGIPVQAVREATPPGPEIDAAAGTLTWRFTDLDPQVDIGLLVSPRAIAAGTFDMAVESVLGFNLRRPPSGERVLVGGLPGPAPGRYDAEDGRDPDRLWLTSERWWDGSIVVPAGIPALDNREAEQAAALCVPVEVGDGIRRVGGPDPGQPGRAPVGVWVLGRVARRDGRRAIIAEAIYDVDALLAFWGGINCGDCEGLPRFYALDRERPPEGPVLVQGRLERRGDGFADRLYADDGTPLATLKLPPPSALVPGSPAWCPIATSSARDRQDFGLPAFVEGRLSHGPEAHIIVDRLLPADILPARPGRREAQRLEDDHAWAMARRFPPDPPTVRPGAWLARTAEAIEADCRVDSDAAHAAHVGPSTTPADLRLVPHALCDPDEMP